ncbi:MAG TPA: MlaD family protein [Bacteroidia bacterium]
MNKSLKILLGLAAVAAAIVFALMYAKGNTVFNKEKKVRAYFPNVEGLIEATPLLLNGFKIGEVTKIGLTGDSADYKVIVTFLLTEDVKIPEKSKVKIVSMDLLQNKGVELILSNETKPMADNELLEGITEESFKDKINQQIAPLKTKADSLIASVDSAMSIFNEIKASSLQRNMVASFESIKKSITVLKQTSGKVDTLMGPEGSAIKGIMKHVNSVSSNLTLNKPLITKITTNMDKIVDADAKRMVKTTMNEVNKAMADAATLMKELNEGKGTAGKAMKTKQVQDNLAKANKQLDLLIKEAIANPDKFIHVSIFAPKKTPPAPDSLLTD